ncbi:MAG: TIGR03621 family F420-dependent LLM class oxidoreductase [Actinomycetota bacterium]
MGVERRVFRFSVMTSGAADAASWRRLVERADDEGYDMLHMPQHRGTKGFSPLVALAFVASYSSRLRIGTLVLDNESVHPAIVARDAATLDLLSGGRLELGIGAGWLEADHASIGQDFAPIGVRIDRLAEAIDVMRSCWQGDTANFDGTHFALRDAPNDPKPAQAGGPPILVGGGGKRVLSLAARKADIVSFVPNMSAGRVGRESAANATGAATAEKLAWVREAAGDRLGGLELHTNLTNVFVTDDRMPMMEKIARGYGLDEPSEALDIPHVVIGTVPQCVEQLLERRESTGISHYTVFEANLDAFAPIIAELAGR